MQDNRLTGETEERLVNAVRGGKQEAIGKLYDAYAPVLMGVISRVVQHTEVAEEVLKETFMAIWTRIDVYDSSKGRFLTWALALARGIAIEANKTGKHMHLLLNPAESGSTPEQKQDLKPILPEAPDNFCHLEPQEKTVIELIYHKGYSCEQAAEAVGITPEQLRARLKSAFKHLGAERTA